MILESDSFFFTSFRKELRFCHSSNLEFNHSIGNKSNPRLLTNGMIACITTPMHRTTEIICEL